MWRGYQWMFTPNLVDATSLPASGGAIWATTSLLSFVCRWLTRPLLRIRYGSWIRHPCLGLGLLAV